MLGKCSICGEQIRSHKSDLHSAQHNFLRGVRKHMWKFHRTAMIARIKRGKRKALENPSLQDLVTALKEAPSRAISIYKTMTAAQYHYTKTMMDAMEPVLPLEVRASWKVIEAIHDEFGK